MLLVNFKNLDSIWNIFKETHDFLLLTDPGIICNFLRTTGRHFRDQRNVRHLTSKLLKCDLVHTLNTFRNPSLRICAVAKASLVIILLLKRYNKKTTASENQTTLYFSPGISAFQFHCFLQSGKWYNWLILGYFAT